MKKSILLIILVAAGCFVINNVFARTDSSKLWVFLKGRPYLSSRKLPAPAWAGFSESAIQRRLSRGSILWNESDFPIDPRYLRAIRAAGAEVVRESRWLNAVSVRCGAPCAARLRNYSFVLNLQGVAVYHRPLEQIEPANDSQPEESLSQSGSLQYGNSRDQLTQLKVPVAHQKGFAGQGEIVAIFDAGFRKDHVAFRNHVIVAEHDYVFDDGNVSNDFFIDLHGTGTWSCVGGSVPGKLYGPAYQAKFILAVTEDIFSETKVEEDNWVAAFEWADRLGATVISSSLGYSDWYQPSDYNGTTPITSRVASTAAKKGIVVVNAAGNSGPAPSTLGAPADAKDILTVGAVNRAGALAGFSSHGPTADGRLKPEVVARGVSTWVASSFSPTSYGRSNGTSFSCPLTAGFTAVLLSAHPDWTPLQVREAIMKTSSRKDSPDNAYGYGIPNMALALEYLPLASVVIDHKPLNDTTNTSQPYKIVATIRAQRGLNPNQSFLFWKREGAPSFTQTPLTPTPNSSAQFQASIPPQPHGTTVLYYLSAKDVKGKNSKVPFHAPQNLFRFAIH